MTKTFANSKTQASSTISFLMRKAAANGLILPSEIDALCRQAERSLSITGSTRVFDTQIIMTDGAKDAAKAFAISRMSSEAFENWAYGL